MVEPASAVVSATIVFWTILIRRDSTELSQPSSGHGGEVDGRDQPVDGEGVDDDEDDADQGRGRAMLMAAEIELLDVGAHLLELAEGLAAPLVLEELVGQVERVPDPVGVEPRAEPLGDDVDEVVLEVLGHAGDEGDPDRGQEQQGRPRGGTGRSCTGRSAWRTRR